MFCSGFFPPLGWYTSTALVPSGDTATPMARPVASRFTAPVVGSTRHSPAEVRYAPATTANVAPGDTDSPSGSPNPLATAVVVPETVSHRYRFHGAASRDPPERPCDSG